MALGCGESPARPPSLPCTAGDGGCSEGPIGGGGGGGVVVDGGGGATDAGPGRDVQTATDAAPAETVRVGGRVALYRALTGVVQNGGTSPATGWTVSPLGALETVQEVDGMGAFALDVVPTTPAGTGRVFGILASPPGRDLRSFRLFDASAGTVVMPAVGLDALQSAVAGAMGLVQPEAGHIVLLARESSDPTARGLAGVRVQPVSEASAVYYDSVLNPEALQLGDAQTGPLGLAVLLNLTAPTMGVREVSMQVTGPTGSVTARVPVLARTVTWVTFTPGR